MKGTQRQSHQQTDVMHSLGPNTIVPLYLQAMQGEVEEVEEPQQQQKQPAENGTAADKDPAKFSGKKSKAAAKQGTAKTQYGIMRDNGIPDQDIPLFR